MRLQQNNCTLIYALFIFCIAAAVIGLYLTFIRERNKINTGDSDVQNGSANIKEGSFNFGFASGLVLILIGIIGSIYCIKTLSECNCNKSSDDLKSKNSTDTINFSSSSSTYHGKAEMNTFTTDPINIDTDKGEPIKIKGLHVKGQSILTLKGDYRFTTASDNYASKAVLIIYLDNVLTDSVNISLNTNADLIFEEAIPIKKQPFSIQLQLKTSELLDPVDDYIYFKNGLQIGISSEEE